MLSGAQTTKGGDKDVKSKSVHKALKVTTVGDGMVGKTCLLITHTENKFPTDYVPTVFDNYPDTITVDNKTYDVTLWDTAGQEDYERLRPMSYPNTDCFLLCFSIGSTSSYENILSKWYPELKHHCPKVPIILVGTKADLRSENKTIDKKKAAEVDLVSTSQGKKMRRKIKAAEYLECSAKLNEGLDQVFIAAVRSAVKKQDKSCCVLQ